MRGVCVACGFIALLMAAGCRTPLPAPTAPELTAPASGALLRSSLVAFAWVEDDTSSSYVLEVCRSNRFDPPDYCDTVDTPTAALRLSEDGAYFWRARAVSEDGVFGVWSDTWEFSVERFRVAGELALPGYAHGVAVNAGRAFVADGQAGLVVVDVSNPGQPVQLGLVMDSLNEAWGVAANESLAFVAYGNKELVVVSTRRSDSLAVTGVLEYPQPAYGYDLVLADTLVYIAADAQFIVANVRDPRYPGLVFQYYYPRSCRDVALYGGYAFAAVEQLGVAVWRLDTFPPVQVGSVDTPGNARGLAVAGGHAFVADGREGLFIADVTDAARPAPVSQIELAGYANSVVVRDTLAFVGCGDGGVSVVNVSAPARPLLVARIRTPYAMGLCASGGYVYACDRDRGLLVVAQEEQ